MVQKGLVVKSTGSWYTVEGENGNFYDCKIKGNFRIKGIKSTNPVAVGDWVDFIAESSSQDENQKKIGLITSIYDRKNYIVRRSQNLSKQSHVIAANIDQALLVVTLAHPFTSTTFIDRYLATAEAYTIPAVIIFNKTDIYSAEQYKILESLINTYDKIGYKCITTSAKTLHGLDMLKEGIKKKINVISGHSGVGKSTIINILEKDLKLKTAEISELHKTGKHTTTYTTLYKLYFGGYIIDTPGIKGFGMLDMEPWEISHYFKDIFIYSQNCQYNNCSHTHEPGCAVKEALQNGKIAESRYISYLGLLEKDDKYRKPY